MRSQLQKIFLWVYAIAAGLFFTGVMVQVFLAGMVVVSRLSGWSNHRDLGHGLGIFLLVMLIAMFPGRLPVRLRWLTGLLFGVYFLQADVVIFMRQSVPYAAALHPVLALFDFLLGQHLLRASIRTLRDDDADRSADDSDQGGLPEARISYQES